MHHFIIVNGDAEHRRPLAEHGVDRSLALKLADAQYDVRRPALCDPLTQPLVCRHVVFRTMHEHDIADSQQIHDALGLSGRILAAHAFALAVGAQYVPRVLAA